MQAGLFTLFIYLLCGVAWRGIACSVYGALGWGPCGVHSVCSVYEAFGLVAFLWHLECLYVYGALGGTLAAFTLFLLFMECWSFDVCGFHSICSFYTAFGQVLLVAFRVLVVFMGDWGGTRLAFQR